MPAHEKTVAKLMNLLHVMTFFRLLRLPAGTMPGLLLIFGMQVPADTAERLLTLDDRDRFQSMSSARLSPDGKKIAYVVDEQIFVSVDGQSRAVTSAAFSSWAPKWSADGDSLFFVSDRNEIQQMWKLPSTNFDEASQVTHLQNGVGDTTLSPDERHLLLSFSDNDLLDSEDEPQPFVVTRRQFKRDAGPGYIVEGDEPHLYIQDLENDRMWPLTAGRYSETGASWSPDGERVVFVSNREQDPDADYRTDLWIVPANRTTQPVEPVRLTNDSDTKQSPRWSPAGDLVAYITAADGVYGLQQVAVVPADGGAPRVLTRELDRMVWKLRFSADGQFVYFNYDDAGSTHLARVDVRNGDLEKLTEGNVVVRDFDVGDAGKLVVIANSDVDSPALYRLQKQRLQEIANPNAALLENLRHGRKFKAGFRSPDGTLVEAFITTPPGYDREKTYPAILNLHGGPVDQFSWGFNFNAQFLAASGYVIVEPNPRGSTGHGQEFIRAIYQSWGITDYDDVIAAIDYAIAEGFADPNRLAVTGYSYGGYMTNVVVTQSKRFRAAASGAGHSLIAANVGHDMYQQWYSWELGVPWENREKYDRLSPLLRAGEVETPTLFLGGRDDWNVPILNAELFYQALKMKGVDSELVVYPDTHHGGWSSEFENDYLQRILRWFDHYLAVETAAGNDR